MGSWKYGLETGARASQSLGVCLHFSSGVSSLMFTILFHLSKCDGHVCGGVSTRLQITVILLTITYVEPSVITALTINYPPPPLLPPDQDLMKKTEWF